MIRILVTGVLPTKAQHRLEEAGLKVVVRGADDLVEESNFIQAIKYVNIYVSGGNEKTTKAVLESANDLKLISFLGVECESYIDVSTASKRGIKVCNTPGANAVSVAEFTIALMLGAQRHIPQTVASYINEDRSDCAPYPTTHIIHGKTIGLVGFGRIAQHVAKICHNGFGAQIQYWTHSGAKDTAKKFDAKYVELPQLLETSDIISIHVPGASNLVLDNTLLQHLKPGALLVNTCPSRIIDPKALLKSLDKDKDLKVAFDNFYSKEEEKNDPDITKLRSFIPARLQVTPHVAWRTFEADDATHAMAFDSITDFLEGRAPRHAVN